MPDPKAYYSHQDGCWYVPCSTEFFDHVESIEPVRLQMKDGELLITLLEDREEATR